MHLWTKAVVLLIVTNSMASSDQSNGLQKAIKMRIEVDNYVTCSKSALMEQSVLTDCLYTKWDYNPAEMLIPTNILNPSPELVKKYCCWNLDQLCRYSTFYKKECEVKDGYDESIEKNRKAGKEVCANGNVDPDKDCAAIKKSVSNTCDKFECSSAHKVMAQSLALIVVSIVTIFLFF